MSDKGDKTFYLLEYDDSSESAPLFVSNVVQTLGEDRSLRTVYVDSVLVSRGLSDVRALLERLVPYCHSVRPEPVKVYVDALNDGKFYSDIVRPSLQPCGVLLIFSTRRSRQEGGLLSKLAAAGFQVEKFVPLENSGKKAAKRGEKVSLHSNT